MREGDNEHADDRGLREQGDGPITNVNGAVLCVREGAVGERNERGRHQGRGSRREKDKEEGMVVGERAAIGGEGRKKGGGRESAIRQARFSSGSGSDRDRPSAKCLASVFCEPSTQPIAPTSARRPGALQHLDIVARDSASFSLLIFTHLM